MRKGIATDFDLTNKSPLIRGTDGAPASGFGRNNCPTSIILGNMRAAQTTFDLVYLRRGVGCL